MRLFGWFRRKPAPPEPKALRLARDVGENAIEISRRLRGAEWYGGGDPLVDTKRSLILSAEVIAELADEVTRLRGLASRSLGCLSSWRREVGYEDGQEWIADETDDLLDEALPPLNVDLD